MADDYCETFWNRYVEEGSEIDCWWGIAESEMRFLVFDATNGLSEIASFRLQAGPSGNVGILTTLEGEESLKGSAEVVEITNDGVRRVKLQLTEEQLTGFLSSEDYSLNIAGVKSFLKSATF